MKSVADASLLELEETNLSLILAKSPGELQGLFRELKSPQDVSAMLEVGHRDFNYWIYRTPEEKRYSTFFITKRRGGNRKIDSPTTNVKILQQKLNQVLQAVYPTKPSVHGFATGKNVKSNAEQHVKKTWVLNVDLENFFPSINFGRVRGMFMSRPYSLPQDVSTVLAHLCCYKGYLPQGAPTSPVVSNMICAQMDSQLQRLAKVNRSTYTRYADDITFSNTNARLPPDLAVIDRLNQVHPGGRLIKVITHNGFSINADKIWLRGRNNRQVVTGITVNDFPNLPRKYANQIRAMLHAWKKYGLQAAQEEWENKYNVKHRAPLFPISKFERVLKGKIEYLGMIKGQDSMTYLKLIDQLGELDPDLTSGRGTPLRLLFKEFETLSNGSTTPQRRGILLEQLINKLFELEGIFVQKSFRRNAGGEQIDGAFQLDGSHYLVECKWQSEMTNVQQVDGLLGKLTRSGAQAQGVFISVDGWSSHVVGLMKQSSEKRIFLTNGQDIHAVLSGKITLVDLLRAKSKALNTTSEPYLSADDISSAARQ